MRPYWLIVPLVFFMVGCGANTSMSPGAAGISSGGPSRFVVPPVPFLRPPAKYKILPYPGDSFKKDEDAKYRIQPFPDPLKYLKAVKKS